MNRKITIVLGGVVLIVGVGIMKFLSSKAEPPKKAPPSSALPVILAKKVENQSVPNKVEVTGKLLASNRVEVFSEVQGVLLPSAKTFKEGVEFGKGERLLRIDSTEFYLNLMATKSNYLNMLVQLGPDIKYDFPGAYEQWNQYVSRIDVKKPLPPLPEPENEKQRNFLTSRDVYRQYYSIKSQEEKLSKYNLTAPFKGVLSEGNLQPGTMIRMGQKLGTLIQPGSYELETAIGLNQMSVVRVGDSVKLYSEDIPGEWVGRVLRISNHIDNTTQTVKAYISVQSNELKEGMYLSGFIHSKPFENAVVLSRSLMNGTNELFVLEDSILKTRKVNVLKVSESEVVVSGLQDNEIVLNQVFSGSYNGLKVAPKIVND
jgi:multidrug efflux pump subunit AcrA (membrane-fusion protein)